MSTSKFITSDHDQAHTGLKVLPSGYAFFFPDREDESKSKSIGNEYRLPKLSVPIYKDEHGIERIPTPHGIRFSMRTRGNVFDKPCAANHLIDLTKILKSYYGHDFSRLFDLLAKTDGGHDYDHESLRVIYLFGKIWMQGRLGSVMHIFHAAGQSYLNEIERLLHSFNNIDGTFIPALLGGDTQTPNNQSDLTPEQVQLKNRRIFNQVGPFLDENWGGLVIRGTKVDHKFVFPDSPNVRYSLLTSRFFLNKYYFLYSLFIYLFIY